jgi:hypothetical protein
VSFEVAADELGLRKSKGHDRVRSAEQSRSPQQVARGAHMGTITYYVALAFKKAEDDGGDIVACDPKEARSSDQAIRMAGSLARTEGHCGAIAFSRTGDPALGDFEDALILKTVGEVDVGLLST